MSSSNYPLEVAPPVKKRKVGTAALTEENGDEEDEDAEGDVEEAEDEEEESKAEAEAEAEAEEPTDAAVAAKKTNGTTAPKKAEVETVDLDDEDE